MPSFVLSLFSRVESKQLELELELDIFRGSNFLEILSRYILGVELN